MKRAVVAILLGLVAACGGDSGTRPTPTPTPPAYPSVGGDYTGSSSFRYAGAMRPVVCTITTTLTQAEQFVSFTPILYGGGSDCAGNFKVVGPLRIDTSGKIVGYPETTSITSGCGTYTRTQDGGFSGNALSLSFVFVGTSGICNSWTETLQLVKQ